MDRFLTAERAGYPRSEIRTAWNNLNSAGPVPQGTPSMDGGRGTGFLGSAADCLCTGGRHAGPREPRRKRAGAASYEGEPRVCTGPSAGGDGTVQQRAKMCPERGGKMSALAQKSCVPCSGGVPPLQGEELARLSAETPDWSVVERHHLEREFRFSNFQQALDFTNLIGALAESEGHHPDIFLAWGKVGVKIWTHKIDGLTESDFVLAAKIDSLRHP
ncbi:MAG: 4a-hydroxytetrahydrobiopterin dehydratase [Bryobacterales bacterium]|nr:4a-hydroxytetrahydrobiopterin dehydratase [Bryobacterales bacterium]